MESFNDSQPAGREMEAGGERRSGRARNVYLGADLQEATFIKRVGSL
jgi:hypothetical protein